MKTPNLSLAAASAVVVVGAGIFTLAGTATLGILRFYALPERVLDHPLVEDAQRDFVASIGLIGAIFLALSACAAWLSARSVYGDIHFVTRRLQAIVNRGDLGEPIAIRTLDEVGALTRSFERLRQGYLEQLMRERAAHQQAMEADRYKSEFLTTVSHELRTPLNAILGFTEVLLAEIEGPLTQGQREDLRMIRTSGEHLLALFNNVLDLSALASGRIKLNREPVDVAAVLRVVASLLEGQRQSKPVAIVVDVPDVLPKVEADPLRLRQIVMNLGANALKFTQSGEVRLSAWAGSDDISIAISDTGIGIAEEDLPALFQEYSQVGARHADHRGSGLGLSIVQRLTRLHGGRIRMESAQGQGSTFTITLPLRAGTADGEP